MSINPNKKPKKPSRLELVRTQAAGKPSGPKGGSAISERMHISLDNLVEDPQNERKTFDTERLQELARSLKVEGQIEPITVTRQDDGKFLIFTGHRRFRAAKLAGKDKLEAIIREPADAHSRRIKSMISNIQREDVPPVELAETLRRLIDDEDVPQRELARRLGKKEDWISAMLRILDLPSPALVKLGTSQVSVSPDVLSKIARISDRKAQGTLVDEALSGKTVREMRERIKEVRPSPAGKVARPASKPKRVYRTAHKAIVVVQATTSRISSEQVVEALKEALSQARKAN